MNRVLLLAVGRGGKQCKRRTRAFNVYKNDALQWFTKKGKKKKSKSPFESFSDFPLRVLGPWVSVALQTAPHEVSGHAGRFPPSWFEGHKSTFFFYLLDISMQKSLRLPHWGDWTGSETTRKSSFCVWKRNKKKKKGLSLNVCKSEYKWPTFKKKKKYEKAKKKITSLFHSLHNNKNNKKKTDWPLRNLSGGIKK